jgi:hypothetical protein
MPRLRERCVGPGAELPEVWPASIHCRRYLSGPTDDIGYRRTPSNSPCRVGAIFGTRGHDWLGIVERLSQVTAAAAANGCAVTLRHHRRRTGNRISK